MGARDAPHRKTPTLTTDQLKLQVLSALQQVHTREDAEHVLAEEVARLYRDGYSKDTAQLWASEFTRRLVERDGATGPTALSQEDISSVVEAMYSAKQGAGQGAGAVAGAHGKGGDESVSEQTREDQLYAIARRDLLLYKDSAGLFWAGMPQKGGSRLHVVLTSDRVSHWLHARYRHDYGTVIRGECVRNVLATLEGDLAEESDTHENFVRLAWHEENGKLYVDLQGNTAAEIDAEGWRVNEDPPVYFRRPPGMLPQVEPQRGGSLEPLRELLGLEDERAWHLLVGFLIAAYHPTGPYPVLVLSGEQGTGKTTVAQLLGRLIDPNAAQLEKAPTREDDIPVQATSRHLLAWDNLSAVPSWFSDALCGLATELTHSRRKLYSDADLYVFRATKPTIINGIEDLATRPDLLSRALLVHLEKMPEAKRKEREVVFHAFDEARPALLGALFDAVSCAMRNKDHIRIRNAPRMADMAYWVTQAEPALGWPWGTYMRSFQQTAEEASSIALESSPLAQGLLQWLHAHPLGFKGYASTFLSELNTSWDIDSDIRRSRSWPKQPNFFTGTLHRIAPALRKQGWKIEIKRTSKGAYVTLLPARSDDTSAQSDDEPEVIVLAKAQTGSGMPASEVGRDGHDDKTHASSLQEAERKEGEGVASGQAEAPDDRHERQSLEANEEDDWLKWLWDRRAERLSHYEVDNEGNPRAKCATCGAKPGTNPLTCLQCQIEVLFQAENSRCRHQGKVVAGTGEGVFGYDEHAGAFGLITTTQTCADCGKTFYCSAPEQHREDYWSPYGCRRCDLDAQEKADRAIAHINKLRVQANEQRNRRIVEEKVCTICGKPSWPDELCPLHFRFQRWTLHHPDARMGGRAKCSHHAIREEGDRIVICETCGGRWQCDHPDLYEKAEGGFGCPDCFFVWTKQNTSPERLAEMLAELEAKYARRQAHTAT